MADFCLPKRAPRFSRPVEWVAIGLCLVVGLAGPGCEFPNVPAGGEGPGHRPQELALSPRQELELGRQAYREVLSNPQKYGRVLPVDRPEVQRVRDVARRVVRAAGIEPLQREINLRRGYRFEWEANVLANDQVNAFCLPGGKIAVFEGILKVTKNDDQLATVLAHEIAHALAHHSSERLAREGLNPGPFGGFWARAFDRAQESEADHIGLFLMTFANYDPEEAVRFWQRMERLAADRPQPPEILSDHPSDARRIHDIQGWIPMALAAKRAYDEGRIAPARGP
jgi:predicted Zn-dependent protease